MGLKVKIEVAEAVQKETRSKRGRGSKRKGAAYENEIAKVFKSHYGVDLHRTPQSGGFAKKSEKADDFRGDIVPVDKGVNLLLHVEAKNHKTWSLKEWLRQAQSDCPEGRIPIVIFKKANTNEKVGEKGNQQNIVAIDLEDFLKLVPKDKVIFIEN
jgi:hypothetical protein